MYNPNAFQSPDSELWPPGFTINNLNPEVIASIAMLKARKAMSRKSGNKVRLEPVTIPASTYEKERTLPENIDTALANAKTVHDFRNTTDSEAFIAKINSGQATTEDLSRFARRVEAIGTGNCFEYSVIAYDFLYRIGVRNMALIQLDPPSTHYFVILGVTGKPGLRIGWNQIPANTCICDPWAHIACSTRDYLTEWNAKMQRWEDRGKTLNIPGASFMKPTQYTLYHMLNIML
jgi:hypothetical protein